MRFDISNSEKSQQRALILDALRSGPLTTIQARDQLAVLSPASRVMELRRAGYVIETRKVKAFDADGRAHRVGVYELIADGVAS